MEQRKNGQICFVKSSRYYNNRQIEQRKNGQIFVLPNPQESMARERYGRCYYDKDI